MRRKPHCSQESRNPLEVGARFGASIRASGEMASWGWHRVSVPSYSESLVDREGAMVRVEC